MDYSEIFGESWRVQAGERIQIYLHLSHQESENRVSIALTEGQEKMVMEMIKNTGVVFSKREQGIPTKMWVTGFIIP
jgi:hypothetical protein